MHERAQDLLSLLEGVGGALARLFDAALDVLVEEEVSLTVSGDTTILARSEALLEESGEVGVALIRRTMDSKLRGASRQL